MRTKFIVTLSIFIVVSIIAFYRMGFLPMVFTPSPTGSVTPEEMISGIFNPFDCLGSDFQNVVAYVIIDSEDLAELPKQVRASRVLKCSDPEMIAKLQSQFDFQLTNSDLATCQSSFIIIENGEVKFVSNLVLTETTLGLQGKFGWAPAINYDAALSLLVSFQPSYSPVVVLGR